MQLKINVNGNLTADELISHIQALEFPAVITGADLKILAKNRASFRYTTGLTVGRRIKKLLPIDDYDKIAKMTAGEVLSSEFIRADRHIGVTVVCGQDCRMMVFQPLSVELYSSINHIYGKMSGYDHSITQNISQNGVLRLPRSRRARAKLRA